MDLRHQRCTLCRIARALKALLSTVGRMMNAQGLGWVSNLESKRPVHRYRWERPADMIHVGTKQLACFERVGHRITGDRRLDSSRGPGYEKAHVAIDAASRLGYVEVLPDEKKGTTVGSLVRAVGSIFDQGIACERIHSDNGSAYRSGEWRKACRALELKPIRTRPYTPRTYSKAEQFIRTLLKVWAFGMCFQTSKDANVTESLTRIL